MFTAYPLCSEQNKEQIVLVRKANCKKKYGRVCKEPIRCSLLSVAIPFSGRIVYFHNYKSTRCRRRIRVNVYAAGEGKWIEPDETIVL